MTPPFKAFEFFLEGTLWGVFFAFCCGSIAAVLAFFDWLTH